MIKRNLLTLILLPLLLLTACQSTLTLQQEEEKTYTGTLRIGTHVFPPMTKPYSPVSTSFAEVWDERSLAFMEKYPGVQIEFIGVDYNQNFEQLLENPSEMPDIMELTVKEAWLSALDHIESLADRIEEEGPRWNGDYFNVIKAMEINGESYLLPVKSAPMIVYYRPDLMAAHQIAEPRDGWTFGEFEETLRRLAAQGLGTQLPDTLNAMEPIIRGLGGKYASSDLRVSGVLDSDATAEAFAQYAAMLRESSYAEEMALRVVRSTESLRDIFEKQYAIAPLPSTVEGVRYNASLMTGLAISKHSQQKELAWEFMKFLLGESSDEAMDFIVNHTLESDGVHTRIGHNPIYEELKQWMKHEITISQPATFDLVWYSDPSRDNIVPQRTREQLERYTDAAAAQADLTLWAQEIEMRAPLLSSVVGGNKAGGNE
ncbi:ABC-type sugar transport system, periplasmic component [Thermobacillus composti KWC4]|uniref:ABC-type sugar transport system, periplasmic component n=1 Tax=Thermobacillus composti (strain DSM 18247 / JCM 13945 / KWC4) TaxID=717605 RepID=L0EJH7_THECK|nr:extracellular solute-binding protein [Thermobacillus composti]AGA59340.1 ABC-type sugar transport system, periplasmic component [Thermobacillus composti KWC4]